MDLIVSVPEFTNLLYWYLVEIDHGIFSMVILSLPLIQAGQMSVSCERMRIILLNRLEE